LLPLVTIVLGVMGWMGFGGVFGLVANGLDKIGVNISTTSLWSGLAHSLHGLGKEFMPSLNECSFLLMLTSMPLSGFEQSKKTLQQLDMAVAAIPEIGMVVGKLGRAETAIDPAPISMYENIINYRPEYALSENGQRQRFKVDDQGRFILSSRDTLTNREALERGYLAEDLLIDGDGTYFRNWREHIKSPDDIWKEIIRVTQLPG